MAGNIQGAQRDFGAGVVSKWGGRAVMPKSQRGKCQYTSIRRECKKTAHPDKRNRKNKGSHNNPHGGVENPMHWQTGLKIAKRKGPAAGRKRCA